jgi:hypothetical protein
MRIAVVQHSLRPAPAQDLEALVLAASAAAASGAMAVVLPEAPALIDGPLVDELWRRLDDAVPGVTVLVSRPESVGPHTAAVTEIGLLGRVALLSGDACLDPEALADVMRAAPDIAVLAPRSESELQAQAVLEFAIGLSTSLVSLVIIAEPDGAEIGEPGHGGSAVVHMGQVIAEAMTGSDTLLFDIDLPAGPPEPRSALPLLPRLLEQRLAAHQGRKLVVDYPADV